MKEEEHPLYASERDDDTTEHVLQYGKDEDGKQRNIKDNTEEEWEEVGQMFREQDREKEKLEERRNYRKVIEAGIPNLVKRKKNRK